MAVDIHFCVAREPRVEKNLILFCALTLKRASKRLAPIVRVRIPLKFANIFFTRFTQDRAHFKYGFMPTPFDPPP